LKVLIAAKTNPDAGGCAIGIGFDGRVVRLIGRQHDFVVGEVWNVEGAPPREVPAPHVEDLTVSAAKRLGPMSAPHRFVEGRLTPACGGLEALFGGKARLSSSGGAVVAVEGGLPNYSVHFWRPDRELRREAGGNSPVYRFIDDDAPFTLSFEGVQEPLAVIRAGTLVGVTLSEPRDEGCEVRLLGWFAESVVASAPRSVASRANGSAHPGRQATTVSKGETPKAIDSGLAHLFSTEPPPENGRHEELELTAPADLRRRSRYSPEAFEPAIGEADGNRRMYEPESAEVETLFRRCEEELHQVFGFTEFRGPQADIIRAVLAGKDALAILPTGGGKSLCFQLPSLVREGLTVVVSPLISLMQDQVQQLRALGVPAVFLNSTLSHAEYLAASNEVRTRRASLLYVAPETLSRSDTLHLIAAAGVRLFAIDEAHCISSWGHDFRPEYRGLMPIRRRFPRASCLALTATATPRVQEDIRSQLGLTEDEVFIAGFDRPNLFLGAARRDGSMGQILSFLRGREEQQGIIYAATRDGVERLAAALESRGFRCAAYHAGLETELRRRRQQQFNRDEIQIIVATIAFGMGINKSNVRYVLHYNLPECLESYYQEVGRAGRDGLRSDCLLLHDAADIMTRRRLIEKGAPAEVRGRLVRLDAMVRYAQALACRRSVLLPYFGDSAPAEPCGMCDRCLAADSAEEVERVEVGEAARKVMAAVQQTGGYFGAGHLIKVLRGSKAEAIVSRKHDRLPVYHTGGDRSEVEWRQLINRLIELGWLDQDQQHGSLQLNPRSREALDGGEVWVPREEAATVEGPAAQHDSELFSALRRLRQEIAARQDIAPYMVFSDKTLTEMATCYPQSPASLRRMHGVGEHKARTYGDEFLGVIREYCKERGLAEKAVGTEKAQKAERLPRKSSPRSREIGAEFAAGKSLEELVQRHGVIESTVLNHLYRWLEEGGRLPPGRLLAECRLAEAERNLALELMEDRGDAALRPIRDELGEHVDYRELHLLRLYRVAKAVE
jgi:ATP-dependent DNA helicase RecQ